MKEWKGNSNSAHAAIAAKKHGSTNKREQDDFYATDPKALEMLLQKCSGPTRYIFSLCKMDGYKRCFIWEPAAGNGNLSYCLKRNEYNVIASDLKYRGYTDGSIVDGLDFLQTYPCKKFKGLLSDNPYIILTNPPYSLATEFIEHALEILPERGLYIALMNITYLAGQKRYQRVYSKGSLREIYVFSKRIECWKNGEQPKDKCGSIANYAWYVFQKGYNGQPTLYWL